MWDIVMNKFTRHALAFTFAALSAGLATSVHANGKAEVKYAQVGDIKMAYFTRGQGEPLVMINGYMSSMSIWDPALLDILDDSNTLVLFDNRGVGLSTDSAEDRTSMEQMADDTAGLIAALGYEKANVLGFSMGARIAQQVFIRHPDKVKKGVLLAPNPGGTEQVKPSPEVAEKLNDPTVPTLDKASLFFPDTPEGKKAMTEAFARFKAAVADGTLPDDSNVSNQTALRQNNARSKLWDADTANFDALKNISFPVLIADGRDDTVDPPPNSRKIASQIPFSWLTFFEGGHGFPFQSYEKLGKTINVFLEDN